MERADDLLVRGSRRQAPVTNRLGAKAEIPGILEDASGWLEIRQLLGAAIVINDCSIHGADWVRYCRAPGVAEPAKNKSLHARDSEFISIAGFALSESDSNTVETVWIAAPGSAKNTLSQRWVETLAYQPFSSRGHHIEDSVADRGQLCFRVTREGARLKDSHGHYSLSPVSLLVHS